MKRLKELRETNRLSQEDLAKKLGVTSETIQAWESGENIPSDFELTLLSSVLGCSLPYLQGTSDVNTTSPESNRTTTNSFRKQISCPFCGSRKVSFVTEYHKSIWGRFFSTVFLAILIFLLFDSGIAYLGDVLSGESDLKFRNIVSIVVFLILYAISTVVYHYIESKTHIQAICKDCSYLWLFN